MRLVASSRRRCRAALLGPGRRCPSSRSGPLKAADERIDPQGRQQRRHRPGYRARPSCSLNSTFGSKDELIRAYLEHRMEISKERLRAAVEAHADPREHPPSRPPHAGRALRRPLLRLPLQPGHRRGPAGQRGLRGPSGLPRLLCASPRPGRRGRGARSGLATDLCSTPARCWPRAWTTTPGSPRRPAGRPRPCSATRPGRARGSWLGPEELVAAGRGIQGHLEAASRCSGEAIARGGLPSEGMADQQVGSGQARGRSSSRSDLGGQLRGQPSSRSLNG